MCGRFTQHSGPVRYLEQFGRDWADAGVPNAPARYNIAPTQDALVLRRHPETGLAALSLLRWGLVPRWAKDLSFGGRTINARAETVASAPAFRGAWAGKRRCVVPVDAFYEWLPGSKPKQPYAIAQANGAPLALAGLWDGWQDPATGGWVRSFTILTCAANAFMARLHDRMPVILPQADVRAWLEGAGGTEFLVPYAADDLAAWPVSVRLNSPKNEGEDLIAPAPVPLT